MADLISGYCVMFNSETVIAGEFRERIAPTAFDKSLREQPDVLALWSHDYDRPLARTSSGTLDLRPDRIGLWFGLNPDDTTPDGLTAIGTVRRQDVRGCSFGFTVMRETWDEGDDTQLPLRIIEEAMLWEITLTPIPAYPETSASLSRASTNATAAVERIRRREAAHRLRGIR
ncbi:MULTISPECIES: HK97 family phage prohead protease [unclassified Mesorhizobium]|uniref:HK97 family phage prohead protease n=1 Tax=unclassified Mesorhizobium TaxID=325217 RepID=UPI00112767B7|nr:MULTISPECIES: HK97 family phage prohead protease [unclassified Mesorhizobium]MCA0000925.1 HK97 family phage prohead protease [Mesorhizobium sp. B264B2A]MCA0004674.1 HK97 family phage prohead protease [Mesorhizobium sp. B264B1B]MCA0019127.1 HK97 family phage prohead protease [Mesorhizobium sp. B264B1A]TPJ38155.1 HK97 family phage prohead protease [Mesorhizobium sp. B2-6-6]